MYSVTPLHSPLKPTDNRLCGAALPRLCPVISPEAASVASFLTAHYNIYNSQMKEEQLWIGKIKWEHGILEYWFTFEYDYRDRWCGQCSEVKTWKLSLCCGYNSTKHFRAKGGYVILIISALATLFLIWVVILLYVCYQKKWHMRW